MRWLDAGFPDRAPGRIDVPVCPGAAWYGTQQYQSTKSGYFTHL